MYKPLRGLVSGGERRRTRAEALLGPLLFTFIRMRLCDYTALPLPTDNIPWYLSEVSRLRNLILDGRIYGLDSPAQEPEAELGAWILY